MPSSVDSAYTSRLTGLYSSLDTDAIVKDLIKIQQDRVDAKKQEETYGKWYGEALVKVKGLIDDFKNTYLSALGQKSMVSSAAYRKFNTEITEGSASAVSISASSGAAVGSYTIDSITQLAENASVTGSTGISADGKSISESNTTKLKDLKFAQKLQFDSEGKISFSINGVTFSFSKEDTLQSMINAVNADEKAGVTMKYSRLTDSFTITADKGGSKSSVTVKNIAGNAFGENGAFGIGEGCTDDGVYGTRGKDAILSIEGVPVTRDSNTFTIDGVTYTLKNTSGEKIKFNVARDVSSAVENIKSFVEAYNELTKKLGDLLNEKDNSREYKPLTAAQEKEMTDEQIEAWTEKAKSGLLHNNRDLRSFLRNIKYVFTSALGGTGKTAASIGIAPAGYFSADAGKILVDEDALTKALEERPETVISMFTETDEGGKGLLYRISDCIASYSDRLKEAIKGVDRRADDLSERIKDMEKDTDNLAEKYYQKFSAMEKALGRLNSQMGLISSLFSS